MRHIPEEELHAYLDQALSRSQAVEIESHLAQCVGCCSARDDIARLRDRTTALLARLGPGTIPLPPFDVIRRRAVLAAERRRALLRHAAWAASVVAALGLGWAARERVPARALVAAIPVTGTPALHLPAATPVPHSADRRLAPPMAQVATRRAARGPIRATVEYDTLGSEPSAGPAGLWRNLSLAGAAAAGTPIPRVAGLPVLQIQVQENPAAAPVVAVDQRLSDGQTVRTIEGPAGQVWGLYAATTVPSDTAGAATLSLRQGDRMLFMTARVSPDSLRALIGKLMTR